MTRCPSTAPDLWTVRCQLDASHPGRHRSNMVTWKEPRQVIVGGLPHDPTVNSEHWVDGRVVLAHEREPDIGGPK